MLSLVRNFGFSIGLTLLAFGFVLLSQGGEAGLIVLILAAIELAFSFDNAIINAKVLATLSSFWRVLFLSLGVVIAIVGVRALLPVLIVSLTAHLPFGQVADLTLHHPLQYAAELAKARPAITAFGGAFLLVLSLQFFMADRDIRWIKHIELPLARLEYWWLPLVTAIVVVAALSLLPGNAQAITGLTAGIIGALSCALIQGAIAVLNRLFAPRARDGLRVGTAALATFVYLEVLDASLSFDGVIGAFAITSDILLIALGLGIGALWVRSLTVYMVRHKTLEAYRYLEHGAHYAIFVLAASMLLAVVVEVPNAVPGFLSLGLIIAAVITSRQAIAEAA